MQDTQDTALTREEEFINRVLAQTENENAPGQVIGGLCLSLCVATFVNPMAGLTLASGFVAQTVWKSIKNSQTRFKILSGEMPVLDLLGDNLEAIEEFKTLVGDEEFNDIISERYSNLKSLPPALKNEAITVNATKVKINPVNELSLSPNALICGFPGSGKDMLACNAARQLKQRDSNQKIFVIDPKGDSKELGYWQPIADRFHSKNLLSKSSEDFSFWLDPILDEFDELCSKETGWKLVVTELNIIGNALDKKKYPRFNRVINDTILGGNSNNLTVWLLAQSPQLDATGITSTTRGGLSQFFILKGDNLQVSTTWYKTDAIAKEKRFKPSELSNLTRKSEVNRAVYLPTICDWVIMPKLENHSGYDRDNRKLIESVVESPESKLIKILEDFPSNDDGIASLEELHNQKEIPQSHLQFSSTVRHLLLKLGRTDLLSKYSL